jgi:catechol 2,3-dioxygenase-like lactoylglutathione lyase family enzyme
MNVAGLDHIVLRVADVERSVAWYSGRLGLEALRLQEWRDKQVFFPSVRVNESTIIDILEAPREGENVDHFCLLLEPGTDMQALADSGQLDVAEGPVERWGARGDGLSIYVRDPDHNLVELRTYPAATP